MNIFTRQHYLSALFIAIVFFTQSLFAQHQGNVWCFGHHGLIDFNSGMATSLSTSDIHAFEGCASICDHDGQLLFYTNNETIWDRNHNPMPNGTGLSGDTFFRSIADRSKS